MSGTTKILLFVIWCWFVIGIFAIAVNAIGNFAYGVPLSFARKNWGGAIEICAISYPLVIIGLGFTFWKHRAGR